MGAGDGHDRGGILRLADLLSAHGEAVEGDLAFYYGVDLRGLHEPDGGPGGLSYRRLGVLVGRLPAESATVTAIRDENPDGPAVPVGAVAGSGPWSRTDMLLAAVIDQVVRLQWTYVAAHSKTPPPEPEPVPRPGVARGHRVPPTAAAASYLRAIRDAHARAREAAA